MIEEKQLLTKQRFASTIEDLVQTRKISYMDAVLGACDHYSIDVEDVRKFITPIIKNKIEAEAMRLNFLPKSNTLPLD